MEKRVSSHLPSFENESRKLFIEGFGAGKELMLIVKRPLCLNNLSILQKQWLLSTRTEHIESYHPKSIAFKVALNSFAFLDWI